jgi:hypothetical protein
MNIRIDVVVAMLGATYGRVTRVSPLWNNAALIATMRSKWSAL